MAAPRGAGAEAVAPVQTNVPKWVVGDSLNNLGNTIEAGLKSFNANQALEEKNAFLSDYGGRMKAIADAQRTGSINSSQADTRRRALNDEIMANPKAAGFMDDIKKYAGFAVEQGSLGNAKSDADDQRARKKDILDYASKQLGIVTYEGMSKEREDSITEVVLLDRATKERLEWKYKERADARAQSAEERAAAEADRKRESQGALLELGKAHHKDFVNLAIDLGKKVKSGELNPQQAQMQLQQAFGNVERGITMLGSGDKDYAGMWRGIFKDAYEYGVKAIDPKTNADDLENERRIMEEKARISFFSGLSPQELKTFSLMKTYPHPTVSFGTNPTIVGLVKRMSGNDSSSAPKLHGAREEKEGLDVVLKAVRHNRTLSGEDKIREMDHVVKFTNNYLQQVVGNSYSTTDKTLSPKDYQHFTNFMSSPEFAEIVKHGGVDATSMQRVREVYEIGYAKEIKKAVIGKLDQKVSDGTSDNYRSAPMKDFVDMRFEGSEVRFYPKGEVNPEAPVSSHMQVRGVLSDLQSAQTQMNKLIKIGAHMEGHNDYRKYWEENKHIIVPGYYMQGLNPGDKTTHGTYLGGDARDKRNYRKDKEDGAK